MSFEVSPVMRADAEGFTSNADFSSHQHYPSSSAVVLRDDDDDEPSAAAAASSSSSTNASVYADADMASAADATGRSPSGTSPNVHIHSTTDFISMMDIESPAVRAEVALLVKSAWVGRTISAVHAEPPAAASLKQHQRLLARKHLNLSRRVHPRMSTLEAKVVVSNFTSRLRGVTLEERRLADEEVFWEESFVSGRQQ